MATDNGFGALLEPGLRDMFKEQFNIKKESFMGDGTSNIMGIWEDEAEELTEPKSDLDRIIDEQIKELQAQGV